MIRTYCMKKAAAELLRLFLYNENPAIVAGYKGG